MLASRLSHINFINRPVYSSLKVSISSCQTGYLSQRKYSTENEETKVKKISAAEELRENWEPIYRFPKIKTVSSVIKLKNYQLTATVFGLPVTYFFFAEHLLVVGYTGTSLVLTLGFISYLLKNSVGFMYVNKKNKDLVRIAYLNFWGSRRDSEFKIDDVVPFSDLPNSIAGKFYTKLKFNNGHEDLKLLSKEVEILDYDKFSSIFGE
ncbi:transmembrane protein 186 [Chironomus tepperi]|uniref:transmembrane protein 186 n=1 Tax=Chironomus tepperi TaxID=113505 RepID=UPI00391FB771